MFDLSPMLIPRIFHWVFLGAGPLPERYVEWMQSWPCHHPDWRCVVWCDKPDGRQLDGFEFLQLPPLVNQVTYDGIEQWVSGKAAIAARSDIVRYEIIGRFGGVYLDTDVECFGAIDQLLGNVRLFLADEWGPSQGNFMFGAMANHPALWTAVREQVVHLRGKGQLNAVQATGPAYLHPRITTHPDCVIFPHILFNPLSPHEDPAQVTAWPTVSLANHRFDGFWYSRPAKAIPPAEFLQAVKIER